MENRREKNIGDDKDFSINLAKSHRNETSSCWLELLYGVLWTQIKCNSNHDARINAIYIRTLTYVMFGVLRISKQQSEKNE